MFSIADRASLLSDAFALARLVNFSCEFVVFVSVCYFTIMMHSHKRTSKFVLEKADTVFRKVKFFGCVIWKPGTCLDKEVIEGTMSGTRVRGRHAVQDNIETWTGLSLVEAVRADHSQCRKIVHDAAKPCTSEEG